MMDVNECILWDLDTLPPGCCPKVRRFINYWRRLHKDGKLPGRQHIDPCDFPDLLPNIRLIDVVGDPPRFKVRLTGEHIRDHFGESYTGKYLDEVFDRFETRSFYRALVGTVETRKPYWNLGVCDLNPDKDFVAFERLTLPLATDGVTVNVLLILSLFGEHE
jgi:hypothetical protein